MKTLILAALSNSRNAVSNSSARENETLPIAVSVHNPDRSPFKIQR
jgi:hypothetical protein